MRPSTICIDVKIHKEKETYFTSIDREEIEKYDSLYELKYPNFVIEIDKNDNVKPESGEEQAKWKAVSILVQSTDNPNGNSYELEGELNENKFSFKESDKAEIKKNLFGKKLSFTVLMLAIYKPITYNI